MPSRQTCTLCHKSKPFPSFHRDQSKTSGFSASCKECRNSRKRAAEKLRRKALEIPEGILSQRNIQDALEAHQNASHAKPLSHLAEQLGCCFTLTVQKDKKTVLTVHGNPTRSYKARIPEEALTLPLAPISL